MRQGGGGGKGVAVDVAVVGAGVFGLNVALACADAGLRVALIDPGGPGASHGPVGALVPHRPTPWRPIKAYQLGALAALPGHMAALAARTGVDPGYARHGRLVPLADAAARARAEATVAAQDPWAGVGRLWLADAPTDWVVAPHGALACDLSARVTPGRYLAALAAALPDRVVRLDWRALALTAAGVACDRGEVAAHRVVVAAGVASFGLTGTAGGGVKGQAALLRLARPAPPEAPLIAGDGLYIVPHGGDLVAVGSTSEAVWDTPGVDAGLDGLIARARALCPALGEAAVVRRWAGIRPRAPGGLPAVGPLPDRPAVILATGGYKIGFGIAHQVGRDVAALVVG